MLKKIIKYLLPYFFVDLYRRINPPPLPPARILFEDNFKKKINVLADNRFLCNYDDIWPCLDDATDNTSFDSHYVYHSGWAARCLSKLMPSVHIDIGSNLYFITIASAFVPIKFYDYRPAKLNLSNLNSDFTDILSLPFPDLSIESISCMHVVEHIGLERYGDPFDPQGDLKAINELIRVLKHGGTLLFVVPLGDQMRIQYNAHRIYTYEYIMNCFSNLTLENFAFINDNGQFFNSASINDVINQKYGCGCFCFKKIN